MAKNKTDMEVIDAIPYKRDGSSRDIIIFIHGLSGSAETWKEMIKALSQCETLESIAYDCYCYPTSLWRGPFTKRMPSVEELANGLKSFIDGHYDNKSRVILVAHSLGGIVARNYILELLKQGNLAKVAGLLLYASPLAGSGWASAALLSWRHFHLQQLRPNSSFLAGMNKDWITLKVETIIKVQSLVAGTDRVVDITSSLPYIGRDNFATIIHASHKSITKPTSLGDLRFKYLEKFVANIFDCEKQNHPKLQSHNHLKDVLFDAYTEKAEPYYFTRKLDEIVNENLFSSNLWISGPPGVGKTAALRRSAELMRWRLYHVMLDGFSGLDPVGLMRELCNTLLDIAGSNIYLQKESSRAEISAGFRKFLEISVSDIPLALLVEEIPLPIGEDYNMFLELCYQLALLGETVNFKGKVVWMFSSIPDPVPNLASKSPKIHEKIRFLRFEIWQGAEMAGLANLINSNLEENLDNETLLSVTEHSHGSPRFLKMVFRRLRNEIAKNKPLSEIIESVRRDLCHD